MAVFFPSPPFPRTLCLVVTFRGMANFRCPVCKSSLDLQQPSVPPGPPAPAGPTPDKINVNIISTWNERDSDDSSGDEAPPEKKQKIEQTLPSDWEIHWSVQWKIPYYWHPGTRFATWTWPTVEPGADQGKTCYIADEAVRQSKCLRKASQPGAPHGTSLTIAGGWVVGVGHNGVWMNAADVPMWLPMCRHGPVPAAAAVGTHPTSAISASDIVETTPGASSGAPPEELSTATGVATDPAASESV